ncbi:hypothetical protein POV27_01730 [Aureisphaera galaxeae]|uniref:hypothetical protein n=1 Tax=Aureisphaera galaxeae TaxID=1538023 RepID=UPI0023505DD7|nr:hypothetical protein [Aureisphaera galaxeae]MDC8002760.1 hypothetical protein [Aureisphaera galaxeae]
METKTHLLHTSKVNNNCPECYSTEGLEFSFSQEEKENKLYSKASKDIKEVLYCHSCEQQIFPVKWTDDIERVYEYHRKLVQPKGTGMKLKPLAYIIILLDAVAIAALIYFLK